MFCSPVAFILILILCQPLLLLLYLSTIPYNRVPNASLIVLNSPANNRVYSLKCCLIYLLRMSMSIRIRKPYPRPEQALEDLGREQLP
ncbi:hypothetical protein FGO68_gene9206 [Halteria grandinella]|uniref:Uncharacterized protein n=1 Tax=Halteria grandinella TaxID=5974 RepID=A0A8J8NKD9_HALGN|nr:hypothetical protein FGO68_gene9206 [Halteria grandinella]